MKRMVLLYILVFIIPLTLSAQSDILDRLESQAVKISKLEQSIQNTKDSMNKIIQLIQVEKGSLLLNISKLKEDSIELATYEPQIKQIKQLRKELEEHKKEMEEHKKNTVSLSSYNTLNTQLLGVQNDLTASKGEVQKTQTTNNKLKDDVSNLQSVIKNCNDVISKRYEDTFDNLIELTTIQSLEYDQKALQTLNIGNEINQNIYKKINELLLYKKAKNLLGEKYDKTKINTVKGSLQQILSKDPVKQLIALLDDFESITANLKKTITDIQKKNQFKAGTINDVINEKKNETAIIIANFVYYNEVDLTKYIYLNQIITELIDRKMKNVDADVQDLLTKL